MHSDCLEELDLEDNLVGDSAVRELFVALDLEDNLVGDSAVRELFVALEHRWLFNTG